MMSISPSPAAEGGGRGRGRGFWALDLVTRAGHRATMADDALSDGEQASRGGVVLAFSRPDQRGIGCMGGRRSSFHHGHDVQGRSALAAANM